MVLAVLTESSQVTSIGINESLDFKCIGSEAQLSVNVFSFLADATTSKFVAFRNFLTNANPNIIYCKLPIPFDAPWIKATFCDISKSVKISVFKP